MWLNLSDCLYYMGSGGITRVEEVDVRYATEGSVYKTALYSGIIRVAGVKETVQEIKELMKNYLTDY